MSVLVPINFRWALAGAFTSQTIAEPTDPIENIATASTQAFFISTPLGRRLVMGAFSWAGSLLWWGAGTTTVGIGLGAAAGAVTGAAVGTAISSVVWGEEGKQKAIKFYTGQADNWYDYVPHYNAYKIIKHYGSDIID